MLPFAHGTFLVLPIEEDMEKGNRRLFVPYIQPTMPQCGIATSMPRLCHIHATFDGGMGVHSCPTFNVRAFFHYSFIKQLWIKFNLSKMERRLTFVKVVESFFIEHCSISSGTLLSAPLLEMEVSLFGLHSAQCIEWNISNCSSMSKTNSLISLSFLLQAFVPGFGMWISMPSMPGETSGLKKKRWISFLGYLSRAQTILTMGLQ